MLVPNIDNIETGLKLALTGKPSIHFVCDFFDPPQPIVVKILQHTGDRPN